MNKQNLIQLLNRAIHIGEIRKKILHNIDNLSEDTIETMIDILIKAENRQKRIKSGDGQAVISEIQFEKGERKQKEAKLEMKIIQQAEKQDHILDEELANTLIDSLNNFFESGVSFIAVVTIVPLVAFSDETVPSKSSSKLNFNIAFNSFTLNKI
jgi:hypothetical protein